MFTHCMNSAICSGVCVCVCGWAQSCLTLCDPMDYSPPGSSVRGISQAGKLEWVAISYSRDLPDPGIKLMSLSSPALAVGSAKYNHVK